VSEYDDAETQTFFEECLEAGRAEARQRRRDGYTVDAARHAAVYAFLGFALGSERGLRVVDELQRAAELEPDPAPPAGVFTGHGQWVTQSLEDDEGRALHVSVCNCGWRSDPHASPHIARAELHLHMAEAA